MTGEVAGGSGAAMFAELLGLPPHPDPLPDGGEGILRRVVVCVHPGSPRVVYWSKSKSFCTLALHHSIHLDEPYGRAGIGSLRHFGGRAQTLVHS